MEHSKKYDKVKGFYDTLYDGKRLWDIGRVRNAVKKGWITADEFKEITGEAY